MSRCDTPRQSFPMVVEMLPPPLNGATREYQDAAAIQRSRAPHGTEYRQIRVSAVMPGQAGGSVDREHPPRIEKREKTTGLPGGGFDWEIGDSTRRCLAKPVARDAFHQIELPRETIAPGWRI